MAPASQKALPIAAWMTSPAVSRVLKTLRAGVADVRFVGGAVRNAVMNLPVSEIDIATPEVPERVIQRLAAAGIKSVPTGLEHGTVMAVADGQTFEITTLRRDTACDGRHAVVEFTTDWHEDARRRDFTFNALSLRPDGTMFDDHGGVEDAQSGTVRFVGDPTDRIREDYLRILRLFRFFAWYGRAPLDPATLTAVTAEAEGLARLSGERIQQEIAKLLAAPAPFAAVKAMDDAGVLARVLPEVRGVDVLAKLLTLEITASDWLRRLAVLLPDESAAHSVAARLKLSNAERERLAALLRADPRIDSRIDPLGLRRALYHLGADLVRDRLLLAWALADDDAGSPPWRALMDAVAAWTPMTLPIGGEDVLALGIAPGPRVGQLLAAAAEWWIGAGFTPARDDILAHLRDISTH